MRQLIPVLCLFASLGQCSHTFAEDFLDYLRSPDAQLIGYTPSQLDPRDQANNGRVTTSGLAADLAALRPAFNGLILYGYHESLTPRLVAVAERQGFRSVVLAIWQPRSADEVDGTIRLAEQYGDSMALAIIVGNEGLFFNRYEADDVRIAADRIRSRLPNVPLATTEPYISYAPERDTAEFARTFGDFLAPNIHPVFDRADLDAAAAARWTREQAVKLAEETGKPLLLKETGFPRAGKPAFTGSSQRLFWETLLDGGAVIDDEAHPVFLNVAFEAFDLPWKAEASGLEFERSWGLFQTDRSPTPAAAYWRQRIE